MQHEANEAAGARHLFVQLLSLASTDRLRYVAHDSSREYVEDEGVTVRELPVKRRAPPPLVSRFKTSFHGAARFTRFIQMG